MIALLCRLRGGPRGAAEAEPQVAGAAPEDEGGDDTFSSVRSERKLVCERSGATHVPEDPAAATGGEGIVAVNEVLSREILEGTNVSINKESIGNRFQARTECRGKQNELKRSIATCLPRPPTVARRLRGTLPYIIPASFLHPQQS